MTYKQETLYGKVIHIGKETENNFRTIEFDVTTWRTLYPNATISIVYQPPTGTAYSPTVSLSGNTLTWSPTRTDTAYEGTGTGQLILINSTGDVVGRSDKFSVIVDDGIASGSTPPDTAPSWVEELLTGIDTVGQAATDAALQVVTTHNASETAHSDLFTAKQDSITVNGIIKGDGTSLSAATPGEDYATPAQVAAKQNALTFDDVPTAGSVNPVKSSGIKTALDEKISASDIVNDITTGGTNKPLSAEQGKTLNESISELDAQLTDYATQFDDIKEELAELTSNEFINDFDNGYINLNSTTTDFIVQSNASFTCKVIDCEAQDSFTIVHGMGSASYRVWAFADNAGNIIQKAELNTICDNTVLQAPPTATKLCLNFYGGNGVVCKGILLKIRENKNKLGLTFAGFHELCPNIVADKYFNSVNNTAMTFAMCNITEPVLVRAGKTVVVIAKGLGTTTGMINTCDDTSYTNSTARVVSTDGNENTYTYNVTSDTYVFITYRYKEGRNCFFYSMFVYDTLYNKGEVDTLFATKQKTLIAGDNITIESDGTISASSGSGIASLIEVESYSEYPNILKNADFANTLSEWDAAPLTHISVVDGELRMDTASTVAVQQQAIVAINHYVYIAFDAYYTGSATSLNIYMKVPGNNAFLFSQNLTGTKTRYTFKVKVALNTTTLFVIGRNGAGGVAFIDNIFLYDLTEKYGTGLEPTSEEFTATLNGIDILTTSEYAKRVIEAAVDIKESQLSASVQAKLNTEVIHGDGIYVGKKLGCIGDSITATDFNLKKYYKYVEEFFYLSGISIAAISGATVSSHSNPMYDMVDDLDNDCSVITVFGGTNDFANNIPLGDLCIVDGNGAKSITSDTSTFYGAYHTLMQNLITRFPTQTIILMTPTHRADYLSVPTDQEKNSVNKYLVDYIDAVKNIGEWYGVPVLDLYRVSGFNPNVTAWRSEYFGTDGLHPNTNGHALIASRLEGFMNTL